MNDEIKEILDNIKNKYEEYYVQDIVSGNDLKLLLDYITNLQQENDYLTNALNTCMIERNKYVSRVEKADEYINKHKIEYTDKHFKDDNVMVEFNEYANPQALLEILQGENNEQTK